MIVLGNTACPVGEVRDLLRETAAWTEVCYGAAFIAQTKSRPVEHVGTPLPM